MKAHLVNCTYCEYRKVFLGDKKKSIPEVERCQITRNVIPHPSKPGRFCDQFHQIGHTCKCCFS